MNKITRSIDRVLVRWFNIHPIEVEKVFTPSTAAEDNYVHRPELENSIVSDLRTPGKQLLVYGHSGSGKTTVIRKILKQEQIRFVITQCEEATTYEQIILNAFDSLNRFIISQKSFSESSKDTASLVAEYNGIKAQFGNEIHKTESYTITPLLPPQLTPQKLASFFGEGNIVWIIEDFHKVKPAEKKRIADIMKIFVDNANEYKQTKVICIGACDTTNELVQLDPNLKNRIAEIEVNLLSEKSIRTIVRNGFDLLNVSITQKLEDKIVYYASRLGTQAHQMCLDICRGEGIQRRSSKSISLKDEAFNFAVNSFINDNKNTLTTIYETAIKNEIGWYVLRTFSFHSQNKLSFREIKKIINNSKKHTFTDDEIKESLNELSSPQFAVILYHIHSDKYSLASPFWEAFLRMQFALEQANKNKENKNKHNQNLKIKYINTEDINALVEERLLELLQNLRNFGTI